MFTLSWNSEPVKKAEKWFRDIYSIKEEYEDSISTCPEAWSIHFNGKITYWNHGPSIRLEFSDEKDYLMFILRWM